MDTNVMELYRFWKEGTLPSRINYGPNDPMTVNMRNSAIVRMRRREYVKAGCPDSGSLASGHYEAASESLENFLFGVNNPTQFQVGGHSGSITRNGSLTVTFTIKNGMTFSSFNALNTISDTFGLEKAGATDNPYGPAGPYHNVLQVFTWTEFNLCTK
jgi:hypothetical protein